MPRVTPNPVVHSSATPTRQALREGSQLHAHVRNGMSAVNADHKGYFSSDIRSTFVDSLNLDLALRAGHQQEHRWDYLLGHEPSCSVVAVEPHSARSDQVSTVIAKREAALVQLREHIREQVKVTTWLWVSSGKVDFMPLSKAILRLNENGIRFVGRQVKAKDLPPPLPVTDRVTRKRRS